MTIAVNVRLLIKDKMEGIGVFTYETLKKLTTEMKENKFIFIFDRSYSDEFIFGDNVFPVVAPPQARHPVLFYIWFEFSIPRVLKKNKVDLFISTDGFMSLSTKVPTIIVLHDINFYHRPKDLPFLVNKYYNHFFPLFAKKARRIITVSNYSKKDISYSYNISEDKIDVVYNGASEIFKPLDEKSKKQIRDKYSNGSKYFLFIGSLHPRKNIVNLLKAYDKFQSLAKSDIKLLIVGRSLFKTKKIKDIYNKLKYKHKIIFTGRVETEELARITASALCLVFVPFFEGFGIPLLEAMNCDIPIIVSNITSMPEVCKDAALYVDPYSFDSISDGMLRITKDEKLRKDLILRGKEQRLNYSWEKTTEKVSNSIKKVIKTK
jgi:glycosyltransferase involved in cell wall biosynthesis